MFSHDFLQNLHDDKDFHDKKNKKPFIIDDKYHKSARHDS